jgi:hypothetical protein
MKNLKSQGQTGSDKENPLEVKISKEPELIVIIKPEAGLRATKEGFASTTGADVSSVGEFAKAKGVTIQPLFGPEERLKTSAANFLAETGIELPDLSKYYRVFAPEERLASLAEEIRKLDVVSAAYIKPPFEPSQMLNTMLPSAEEPPSTTPDFISRQGYLEAAPVGVDAKYAWTKPGGGGAGIKIIDIEGAWRFSHEDLIQNQGGVIAGTQSTDSGWRNHGTAVNGEFGADQNTFGVTGISPDAYARAISIFGGTGSAGAIRQAADALSPGDIILIELHAPGPRYNFQSRNDQKGYIAIEWWPDDFDAIKYATGKGVIVVEAGGNGAENLDDAIYNTPASGFPAGWTNPFNRSNRDSGSIVVGAGNPPSGTHGRTGNSAETFVDRARCGFSNYGAIIDAQGWGWEVTTCGYGDLQGGSNEDYWYTDTFSGTSSASPIVVGALACVQGILYAQGKTLMTPAKARSCLRSTGSSQQDAAGRSASQRIGNRPNIQQLLTCASKTVVKEILKDHLKEKEIRKEVIKENSKDVKDLKDRKEKEMKEKDIRDVKQEKDLQKNYMEFELKLADIDQRTLEEMKEKIIKEKQLNQLIGAQAPEATETTTLEDRLTAVEGVVMQLAHFIGLDLRPNMSQSSLTQEADQTALSSALAKQATNAKQAKDCKDLEKTRES